MSFSGPDRPSRPIRRLRVVPNPTAAARAGSVPAVAWSPVEPVRSGGRHRKYDPDDHEEFDSVVTDVVPSQRVAARLTVPPPVVPPGSGSRF